MPPSGKTFAEILLAVLKELYEKYEDISEKKSKALRGYKRHAFMESWYPPEWETFVTYGAGSPQPVESLKARLCHSNLRFTNRIFTSMTPTIRKLIPF